MKRHLDVEEAFTLESLWDDEAFDHFTRQLDDIELSEDRSFSGFIGDKSSPDELSPFFVLIVCVGTNAIFGAEPHPQISQSVSPNFDLRIDSFHGSHGHRLEVDSSVVRSSDIKLEEVPETVVDQSQELFVVLPHDSCHLVFSDGWRFIGACLVHVSS